MENLAVEDFKKLKCGVAIPVCSTSQLADKNGCTTFESYHNTLGQAVNALVVFFPIEPKGIGEVENRLPEDAIRDEVSQRTHSPELRSGRNLGLHAPENIRPQWRRIDAEKESLRSTSHLHKHPGS